MDGIEADFLIGARCQLSQLGRHRNPRSGISHCEIIGYGATALQLHVLFNGTKTPVTLHTSYLTLDEGGQASADADDGRVARRPAMIAIPAAHTSATRGEKT
jgi:hypothetical protein